MEIRFRNDSPAASQRRDAVTKFTQQTAHRRSDDEAQPEGCADQSQSFGPVLFIRNIGDVSLRYGNIAACQPVHAAAQEQNAQHEDINGRRSSQAGQAVPNRFGKGQQQETYKRSSYAEQQDQTTTKPV